MVFIGERCLRIYRFLFLALGLWPYQKPIIWRIQAVFFFTSYFCTLFFQFTPFLTTTCNIDCILKRFSYICICSAYVLNYYAFYFNSEPLKKTLKYMRFDWKMFENSDARKIFEEYFLEVYNFIISTFIFMCVGGVVFLTIECRAVILDIIIPMNESRERQIEIDFESFLDKQQYFFLYIMQEILGVGIGVSSIIFTGTFCLMIIRHFSAAYKIASDLIRNTATIDMLELSDTEKMRFMHRNICFSVYIHRRTWSFCEELLPPFNVWYSPLLIVCVVSLSCLLFRLYNAVAQLTNIYDIFVSCVILYCYLIYMFMGNFFAQSYSDHSIKILDSAYDTLWYTTPLQIQKLLLFMHTCIKNHKVVMGGLFVPSMEGFSTLVTTALSYFTVMHAMRS